MTGDGGDELVGRGSGGAVGKEEAGDAEAERLRRKVGGGDGGGVGYRGVGVFDDGEERLATPIEIGVLGCVAGVLDGEAEADGGGGLLEFGAACGLEELGAVAEEERGGGGRIPENVAESAEGGGVGGDGVPVGVGGLARGSVDDIEAARGEFDGAGVDGSEVERIARSERFEAG